MIKGTSSIAILTLWLGATAAEAADGALISRVQESLPANWYTLLILGTVVLALAAMVPLISLVQDIGRQRQEHLLNTLQGFPVANSLYYRVACNYFKNLEPFKLDQRYRLPVLVLFLVTVGCASVTYFGAEWTNYLQSPNYVLGGAFILVDPLPEAGKILEYQTATAATACAAFIGAYVYLLGVLLNRINNDDIPPITYYYFAARLLIACLVAGIVRHALAVTGDLVKQEEVLFLIPIGFVVGLQPDLGTKWLLEKVSKKLKLSARQRDPADLNIPVCLTLLLIEGLTDAKRDRLEELDLDSCQALAEHNPFIIFARTSYQLLHVIDWMAQAQLIMLAKDDGIAKLRAIGVRDIFGLEIGLAGGSKQKVAEAMGISVEAAADMLIYLGKCPAFTRLKEVAFSLAANIGGLNAAPAIPDAAGLATADKIADNDDMAAAKDPPAPPAQPPTNGKAA